MDSLETKADLFESIVEEYTSPVFNFARRFAKTEDAEDLTQETFLKIWKNLEKFDERKASLKTWIFTIARNTIFDFLRKKKIINFSELEKISLNQEIVTEIESEEPWPDQLFEKIQNIDHLNQALAELNEIERTVLVLYYQADLSLEAISQIMKKPLNTIKSYRHRAILKLRQKLSS